MHRLLYSNLSGTSAAGNGGGTLKARTLPPRDYHGPCVAYSGRLSHRARRLIRAIDREGEKGKLQHACLLRDF